MLTHEDEAVTDSGRGLRGETAEGETFTAALRSSIQKKASFFFSFSGVPIALRRRQTLRTGLCRVCSQLVRGYFSFIMVDSNMKTAPSQRPISRTSSVKGSHFLC